MIDPRKSLIIFTYPRSGSTWFQDKLIHLNLQEMMNYNVKFKFTRNGVEYERVYDSDRPPIDETLRHRIELFRWYHNTYCPVSLKIQTRYLHDSVIDALQSMDFQYIVLRRKDRLASLLSFLIVTYTAEWGGKTTPHTITVDKSTFDSVLSVLKDFDNQVQKLEQIFPMHTVYFEDALSWQSCNWWKASSNIVVQNAKSCTTIINKSELDEWIAESKYV